VSYEKGVKQKYMAAVALKITRETIF